jgi:hypothetical protein
MKPNLCETCLVQALCSNPCQEFHDERDMLDSHISKLNRHVFTKKDRLRKRLKQKNLKHYHSLLGKWTRNINQMNLIQSRRFIKTGVSTFMEGTYRGTFSNPFRDQ